MHLGGALRLIRSTSSLYKHIRGCRCYRYSRCAPDGAEPFCRAALSRVVFGRSSGPEVAAGQLTRSERRTMVARVRVATRRRSTLLLHDALLCTGHGKIHATNLPRWLDKVAVFKSKISKHFTPLPKKLHSVLGLTLFAMKRHVLFIGCSAIRNIELQHSVKPF